MVSEKLDDINFFKDLQDSFENLEEKKNESEKVKISCLEKIICFIFKPFYKLIESINEYKE